MIGDLVVIFGILLYCGLSIAVIVYAGRDIKPTPKVELKPEVEEVVDAVEEIV